MTAHYLWCDPPRCTPPVHRSRVVPLPTLGAMVPTYLRLDERAQDAGPVVLLDFGVGRGCPVRLSTLQLWQAEVDSLTQPRRDDMVAVALLSPDELPEHDPAPDDGGV